MLPFPIAYAALLLALSIALRRTLMPVLPVLAVVLGTGLAGWLDRLRRRRAGAAWAWGAAVLLAAVALAAPAARSGALLARASWPTTRELAREWMLERFPQGGRSVGKLTQDRLAADDDDRVVGGDDRGGADQVLELLPGHERAEKRSRVSRQIRQRSSGGRAPANGVDWRSSFATSLRSARKAAIDAASPDNTSAHFRA